MPKRVQMHRRPGGWRGDHPNAVIVDRTTMWGNPWRWTDFYRPGQNTTDQAVAEAVRMFRAVTLGFESGGSFCRPNAAHDSTIGRIITRAPIDLRGRDLACWCPLDCPCHADVLIELANA